ncbi:hypothetical protein Tco_1581252 [Tanacetum coccineum]
MDEQSHYKQDKTITRQRINVKCHIFNVIGGTEEFEERDLNIGGDCEFALSTLDVLQRFGFILQMSFTLILATLDGLDMGLLGDVIGEDECDDDG